jgi:serine/threonine-protein kinase
MSAASVAEGLLPPFELEPAAGPESDQAELTPPVATGSLLAGRYSIETVLAEGGMGVVWLGRHVELDKPVAIKFLRRALCGKDAVVARFLNEARAAAALRSNHVVKVIDVGQLESGRPYLVMEHLEGTDLDALVERGGPLPVERAVDYALQVCEALAEAHGAGIVHRDIKPENLFLSQAGPAKATVKVVDFGLAKRLDGAGAKVVTGPLENMGSPCYMSPEQIGTPQQVDERTDIWSLGVVLYRLLTGILPFDGDSLAEVCARVLNAAPAPLREGNPELDANIESIVARCLEKKPEDRFASVGELAKALERYVDGAVSATRPASLTQSSLRTLAPPKSASDPSASATPLDDEPITEIPGVRPLRGRSIALALLLGFAVPLAAVAAVRFVEHSGYRPLAWTEGWFATAATAESKTAVAKPAGSRANDANAQRAEDAPPAVNGRASNDLDSEHLPPWLLRASADRGVKPAPHRLRVPLAAHPAKPEEELTPEEIVRRKLAYEEYLQQNGLKPIGEALQQMKSEGQGVEASSARGKPAPTGQLPDVLPSSP